MEDVGVFIAFRKASKLDKILWEFKSFYVGKLNLDWLKYKNILRINTFCIIFINFFNKKINQKKKKKKYQICGKNIEKTL